MYCSPDGVVREQGRWGTMAEVALMTPATGPPPRVARTINPGKTALRRVILGAALVALIVVLFRAPNEVSHPPGILVPEEPFQAQADRPTPWEHNGYTFTPLAYFRLRARVLHTERYWFDELSGVSPIDLAVGWGPMSDGRIVEQFSFSQGGRWYSWKPKNRAQPISHRDLARYSANMHLIPATVDIDKRLRDVRAGHIVHIAGDLVAVQDKDGRKWTSSLSRTDTGGGSCEVIWVRELKVR